MANTVGTKNSVATVANSRPPITARPKRRVLLAAFAQAQRHRHHADDHGQRRHQHRAKTRVAGLQRGLHGGNPGVHALAREADHQDLVRRRHAHAHDGAGQRRHAQRGVR